MRLEAFYDYSGLSKKITIAKERKGSFAIENILEENEEKVCEQSPLKGWIKTCKFAELRSLTEEEKSRLKGKVF